MFTNRRSLTLCSILFYLINYSCASAQTDNIQKNIDTIYSKILNQQRIAWVYSPQKSIGETKQRFPVVFVLDAEANFHAVVNTIRSLQNEGKVPKLIVVGVGFINPGTIDVNAERTRDYTPSHVNSCPYLDPASVKASGGGKNFALFLEKELIPYINTKYPTTTSRILIGHSFGGLTAMNIFLNFNKLFDSYLAIDPSMWWDDHKLLNEIKTSLPNKDLPQNSLFIAVANSTGKRMNVSEIMKDNSEKSSLIKPSLELTDHLKQNSQKKLNFNWQFYPDHDHGSVYQPAVYDGLKFILNGRSIQDSNQ